MRRAAAAGDLIWLRLALLLMLCLLGRTKRLSDDREATLTAAHQKKSTILGDDERQDGLDDVVCGDVDPLEWSHEWELSDDHVAPLGSVDQSFHEIGVLDDLRGDDVAALFMKLPPCKPVLVVRL